MTTTEKTVNNQNRSEKPIYLDNNSTTPLDRRVLEAMMPYLTDQFGNASSTTHKYGATARKAIENARKQVADLINATADEIVFTSGATESNNLAIKGIGEALREKGNHIITTTIEHKATLAPCEYLAKNGFEVTFLQPDEFGMITPQQVEDAITDKTILITIMLANNEIGTILPIAEIGKIAREKGIIFHTDAAQGCGKIPLDVNQLNVDLMSLSAHKFYGPKGIGALYIRKKDNEPIRLIPQIHGGGHEKGIRSGTYNVPGIVGMGKAAEIAKTNLPDEANRLRKLRDKLHKGILDGLDNVKLNGHPEYRLPKAVLEREIAFIAALGVEIKTNMRVGQDVSL